MQARARGRAGRSARAARAGAAASGPRRAPLNRRPGAKTTHTPARVLAKVDDVSEEGVRSGQAKGPTGEYEAGGDVYVVESTPLSSGVKKHTILIFVSDESGIINRVSSVFSRR